MYVIAFCVVTRGYNTSINVLSYLLLVFNVKDVHFTCISWVIWLFLKQDMTKNIVT